MKLEEETRLSDIRAAQGIVSWTNRASHSILLLEPNGLTVCIYIPPSPPSRIRGHSS